MYFNISNLSVFPAISSISFPLLYRNAQCPPTSWVDSGSVHPWHCVGVSHTAVPRANRLCCQREQHRRDPARCGESGRPG